MKVYLVETIDNAALDNLKQHAEITTNLNECDIILTRNLSVNQVLMDAYPNIKAIAIHGTGVSEIDVEYAKSKGIVVFNAPYQNCDSVAEMNVMLTLMALRKANIHSYEIDSYLGGLELKGKTVGILGYGHIGSKTAKLIKAFGAKPLIYNRTPKDIELESLDYVIENSDILILSMALEESNYHIIDSSKIDKMKNNVIIVNTARGGLVDENAILEGLQNKKIGCYATDVFENEPVDKTNPLLTENVIFYPHIGSNTIDALAKVSNLLVDEIIDYIKGNTPKHIL